jgi:hypothetical protein
LRRAPNGALTSSRRLRRAGALWFNSNYCVGLRARTIRLSETTSCPNATTIQKPATQPTSNPNQPANTAHQ